MHSFDKLVEQMKVSDDELVTYIKEFFAAFRMTVEEFFPQVAPSLSLYADAPFHTTVVRFGPNAVIIGHRHNDQSLVEVRRYEDFDPPFDSPNIFDISKRLQFRHCYFSAAPRTFDANEAHANAVRDALSAVLEFFWFSIPDEQTFATVIKKLIEAEGIKVRDAETLRVGKAEFEFDAKASVLLREPAGYRRFEDWAFEFKHKRVSANDLRQIEKRFTVDSSLDCLCLVTSDDLTSISTNVASENTRIRVWDRSILNRIIHAHPAILRSHFNEFPHAIEELSRRMEIRASTGRPSQSEEFANKLKLCPTGQQHFTEYEDVGMAILSYLFEGQLGPAKPQVRTLDEKQRRDVLYRNNRATRFFERCFVRFASDFLIVDFKNYGEEITSSVVTDVDKYANKALGRLILVVSRKGASQSVEATQQRVFRDSSVVVLVVSDADLLEMVQRKEREQSPEDVIEDKLDELLAHF